jgi:hypothetical protein
MHVQNRSLVVSPFLVSVRFCKSLLGPMQYHSDVQGLPQAGSVSSLSGLWVFGGVYEGGSYEIYADTHVPNFRRIFTALGQNLALFVHVVWVGVVYRTLNTGFCKCIVCGIIRVQ